MAANIDVIDTNVPLLPEFERLQELYMQCEALEFKERLRTMLMSTFKEGHATPSTFILCYRINHGLSILQEWAEGRRKCLSNDLH